jgi:CheY-like chemotaxis protein
MCNGIDLAKDGELPVGILVVENHLGVLNMIEAALGRRGFDIFAASGGEDAVEIYCQNKPRIALALLDVQMSPYDGPQTLAVLRQLDPDLPAIFMTGGAGQYSKEQLLGMGAPVVLAKPFVNFDLVAAEVRAAIGHKPPLSAAGRAVESETRVSALLAKGRAALANGKSIAR